MNKLVRRFYAIPVLALVATLGMGGAASPAAAGHQLSAVDCSQVHALGIDRELNLRASALLVQCGLLPGGSATAAAPDLTSALSMLPGYGGTDKNLITGAETYPSVTQSESFIASHGRTIVVNYNDSRTAPGNYSGLSYSTDGGATWQREATAPFANGHGTNDGDPIIFYNKKLATWFGGDLVTGCGGFGIGLWTSKDGITWTTGACAHNGGNDDRESMWVDNSPHSPHYGRMYVAWNDFNVGGGALFVTHSDNGTTWSSVQLTSGNPFIREVQLTGASGRTGTVYAFGMNENGGAGANRNNLMYRSTDGGATWTTHNIGTAFPAPGNGICGGYFYAIPPIWRYMGWGQPAVGPSGVLHYVYTAGRAGDLGDIMYTRSTDNGNTWSAPITLNTDAPSGTKSQWMPSLAVTRAGHVLASWYDRRNTTDGTNYQYYSRASTDNGVTWQPDAPTSDVLIPQPLQPDPNIQSCYAGDYNYHIAAGTKVYVTWTDGRVAISGHHQQDVFFDQVTP